MHQRLLMCLMLIVLMLYYAVPHIREGRSMEEIIFSIAWMTFALLALGGNLAAIIQPVRPKKLKRVEKNVHEKKRAYSS